jgi:hypothetical protein
MMDSKHITERHSNLDFSLSDQKKKKKKKKNIVAKNWISS